MKHPSSPTTTYICRRTPQDKYYKHQINKCTLHYIIIVITITDCINFFASTTDYNVDDDYDNGKPSNLLYCSPFFLFVIVPFTFIIRNINDRCACATRNKTFQSIKILLLWTSIRKSFLSVPTQDFKHYLNISCHFFLLMMVLLITPTCWWTTDCTNKGASENKLWIDIIIKTQTH